MPDLTNPERKPFIVDPRLLAHVFDEPADHDEDAWSDDAWWSLSLPDGGGVHMRVRRIDPIEQEGWAITDVYVHASQVTATMLQNIPVSRLDLMMNQLGEYGSDIAADLVNQLATEAGWGAPLFAPSPDDDDPTLAQLRDLAADAPPELPHIAVPERPRLARPDGTDPDSFYALVADAYREYAPQTRAPAVKIAEEAAVPVGTAHGWIREARRRGKLPRGRKGKAG
jgi:hypothetical protein